MKQQGTRTIWSVGEITSAIWRRFEDIPSRWIEGEITNLTRSGQQVYFTLVDPDGEDATQIDASMYAVVFDALAVRPVDGALVQAYGRVQFWRRRSQVRLRVERLAPTGDGALLARIEDLKRRLAGEGLTDPATKRPIPVLPRRIGLVTSRDGAARVDFIRNVTRRLPSARILVVHSLVQGDSAPAELVRAIRHLDRRPDVDVIVLARGGGAIEDLMAFNSEAVCRAVADCATPVVSAIGHETDVTVCDLVADLRVSTPTKAAEAVVPDAAELGARLDGHYRRARAALGRQVAQARAATAESARRLVHGLRVRGALAGTAADTAGARLAPALRRRHLRAQEDVVRTGQRLTRGIDAHLRSVNARVTHLAAMHELLSPHRTVARGYAIVRDAGSGRVLEDGAATHAGQELAVEFRDRTVEVTVVDREGT